MRSHMTSTMHRFARDDGGATAIEYSIIAAILAVAVIGVLGSIRDELDETFLTVGNELAENNTGQ